MIPFIKTKKSDDQTNIDIYRIVANITEYHIRYSLKEFFLIVLGIAISRKNSMQVSYQIDITFKMFLYYVFIHTIQSKNALLK